MVDKVAAIQMNSSDQITENLQMAGELIAQASRKGASLVVLPEMFAIVTPQPEILVAAAEAEGKGPIQDFLAEQARRHHIWLVGGTIPIRQMNTVEKNAKISAACLLYNPEGNQIARYDKIHLFDVSLSPQEHYQESATICPGHSVIVKDTPLGKLGLAVCYDIRFPELFRLMFNQDAEIFALPAAFTLQTGQAHWEVLARSRAIENFSYFIGACQNGIHAGGRRTYGHSMIVSPWGEVLAILPEDVGVILATIDLQYLEEVRKKIPAKKHQRFNEKNL